MSAPSDRLSVKQGGAGGGAPRLLDAKTYRQVRRRGGVRGWRDALGGDAGGAEGVSSRGDGAAGRCPATCTPSSSCLPPPLFPLLYPSFLS